MNKMWIFQTYLQNRFT